MGVTVGLSHRKKGSVAGREAAQMALGSHLPENIEFALIYATANYAQDELLSGIREALGEVPFSGCSGEGVVTQEGSDESTHVVSVMLFEKHPGLSITNFLVKDFSSDPEKAGREIARQVSGSPLAAKARALLLMPDGFTSDCSKLLEGIEAALPFHLPIAGGSAGDSLKFQKAFQYHNGGVYENAVSAVLLSGDLKVDIGVTHGCEPIGSVRTITASQGNRLQEIDGKSATLVYREYSSSEDGKLDGASNTNLAIGHRLSEEDTQENYGNYIICAPMGVDEKEGSLLLSRALPVGTKIQMHRRDPDKILTNTRLAASAIKTRNDGKVPYAVIHFECAARGRIIFADRTDEVTIRPLQDTLGRTVPWIGFHCFGEIAPITRRTHFHNYTAVVCSIYE